MQLFLGDPQSGGFPLGVASKPSVSPKKAKLRVFGHGSLFGRKDDGDLGILDTMDMREFRPRRMWLLLFGDPSKLVACCQLVMFLVTLGFAFEKRIGAAGPQAKGPILRHLGMVRFFLAVQFESNPQRDAQDRGDTRLWAMPSSTCPNSKRSACTSLFISFWYKKCFC